MYGTVARFRPKAGQEKALLGLLEEWKKNRQPKVKGAMNSYLYKLDKKPGEFLMAVVFQDKKSYTENAENPEQDKWYRSFRQLLQADPVWEDGEIISS